MTVRISTQEKPEGLTLKIEGRVIGEWAAELERFWELFHPLIGANRLWLDICDVMFLDLRGKQILHKIFVSTGAEILADSPLTRQFADEVKQIPNAVKQIPNKDGLGEVYE
ncbi:MAG TPA: hypothetical protein VMU92_05415 [Acidobacteriaceae bacterium]|nr:hypothetical protein [Acidobacteriaceae bacterium]